MDRIASASLYRRQNAAGRNQKQGRRNAGIRRTDGETEKPKTGIGTLLVQGVATSIDALSVGFTTSQYGLFMAVVSALIIAAVTFIICMAGLIIGKKFGTKLSNKAAILGGIILIIIGLEIFFA